MRTEGYRTRRKNSTYPEKVEAQLGSLRQIALPLRKILFNLLFFLLIGFLSRRITEKLCTKEVVILLLRQVPLQPSN